MSTEIIVGIDIGGTSTKFGLVDESGNILYQGTTETRIPIFRDYLDNLEKAIHESIEKVHGNMIIKGIGVGAPNASYYTGSIEQGVNLPWNGVPIVKYLTEDFGVPVVVTNDANAAAMGEAIYGHAREMKDFVVITLGTGLGSGIVTNGHLVHGHQGFAAELGHVKVYPDGRQCGCGRKGCLETYVSATGIKRTVFQLLADHTVDSELRDISFNDLSTKMITECANRGDTIALKAFEFTGRILGIKLADTVAHLDPEAIFILGGLAQAGEFIFEPTIRHMENNLMPIFQNKVRIMPSGLENQSAPILGATSLIVNYFKQQG
jgi:glucokinase